MVEFITASIITERVTEMVKGLFPEGKRPSGLYISTCLGILFAVSYGLDLPNAVGFATKVPFLGEVLTGFLISGGSAGTNALLEALQNVGKPKEVEDVLTISD